MYYTPGTVLSYAGYREECIVITGGDVMVTKTQDNEWRERMKLIDWLITAQGGECVIPHLSLTADDIWKNAVNNATKSEEAETDTGNPNTGPLSCIGDIDESLYDDISSISSSDSADTSSTESVGECEFGTCGCRRTV